MLTEPEIEEIIGSYKREQARFEDAAESVATRAQRESRAAAIRSLISYRAKHPDDLAGKLRKKSKNDPRYTPTSLQGAIDHVVTDLAGCRLIVYRPRDVEALSDVVRRVFPAAKLPGADEVHDKPSGYRATHLLVHPTDDARPSIQSTIVEVQVCSLADHLFNELEHDSIYKDPGPGSGGEKSFVTDLLHLTRVADQTAARLFDARAQAASERKDAIAEAEDLRFVLEQVAKRPLTGDFVRLFKFLNSVTTRLTPAFVKELGVQEHLERGRATLAGHADLVRDDVACLAVGLSREYGEELRSAAATWRGPPTPLKRAIVDFVQDGES